MRWTGVAALVCAGVVGACADDPTTPDHAVPALSVSAELAAGHVIEFSGKVPEGIERRIAELGGQVDFVNASVGFAKVSGLSAEAAAALSREQGVGGVYEDALVQLDAEPVVGEMEAVDLAELASVSNPAGAIRHSYQWNLRVIGANTAWSAGFLGSADVTIAILDSGIDYDSYDMNGMVDLSRSVSFVPSDNTYLAARFPGRHPVDDLNGHGTNVATVASSNGTIFAGVNSRTKLIGVKVLGRNGSGSLGAILGGLAYAADAGADVANMSLGIRNGHIKAGGRGLVGLASKVFNYAHSKGMVVVVAAGNDGADMDNDGVNFRAYCEAPHVVCVAATGPTASTNAFSGPWTNQDAPATYSNYGREAITVAAPGGTTRGWVASVCARHRVFPGSGGAPDTYVCNVPAGFFVATGYAGTSQAAPHVAGFVAKLVEIHGKNNPAQVVHALRSAVDDLGPEGKDANYGWGRINIMKGLQP